MMSNNGTARTKAGKLPRKSGVFLPPEVMDALAFHDLNGTEIRVLLDFCGKRRINPRLKRTAYNWSLKNGVVNGGGGLIFTYLEAADRGYSTSTFRRAIDGLIDHGFIDVDHPYDVGSANTTRGEDPDGSLAARYSMSDRWPRWGTDDFEERPRPKRTGPMRGRPFESGKRGRPNN